MRPEIALRYGLLLLLAGLTGCIPFVPCHYVYPSISCVPSVAVDAPPDEIHAFRVDIVKDDSCIEFMGPSSYRLTPMRVWPGGRTCPQVKAAVDHGWIWNCIALSYGKHFDHTLRVRLYRPGFELIEVSSWELPEELRWVQVSDATGQEKAIDALLAPVGQTLQPANSVSAFASPRNGWKEPREFWHLKPGWFSTKHRQSLEFGIAEYQRVATAYAAMGQLAAAENCSQKADRLRSLTSKD
jgi:hypothetical protein